MTSDQHGGGDHHKIPESLLKGSMMYFAKYGGAIGTVFGLLLGAVVSWGLIEAGKTQLIPLSILTIALFAMLVAEYLKRNPASALQELDETYYGDTQ